MSMELQSLDSEGRSALPDSVTAAGLRAPCGSFSGNGALIKLGHGGFRRGAGRKPVVIPVHHDEPRWYCIRTLWGQDIHADMAIRQCGFEVFAPTIWKPPVPARRLSSGAMRQAREARIQPLFSRYLFTRFNAAEPSWRAIRGLRGVEAILSSSPETPIPLPETALDAVRSLCAPNGCVYPPGWDWSHQAPVRRALEPGCQLRVLYGPFADHVGICQMSDGKRVALLLEILGRSVAVKVAQSDVEVAS